MNSCPLNMLHNTGDQYVLPVGDHIHFQLNSGQILIDQHRIFDPAGQNALHIGNRLLLRTGNGHVLPTDDIRRPEQYRIAQCFRRPDRFLHASDRAAAGTADSELFQQPVKPFPVFRDIDGLRAGAENRNSVLSQGSGQPDGGLPSEGHHHADGLFHVDNPHHILRGQRLKIQTVRGIIVGGYGLGIIVDDDRVIPHLLQRPDTVNGAVVKFNALPDADGPAAQHHHHRPAASLKRSGFTNAVRA